MQGNLRHMPAICTLFVVLAGALTTAQAQTVSLQQSLDLALASSPEVMQAEARMEAARASLTAVQAFHNPELEYLAGETTSRQTGSSGRNEIIGLSQPLDLAGQRMARRDVAQARVDMFEAALESSRLQKRSEVKRHYFDVLKRKQEVVLAQENLALLEQIRNRVKIKVNVGESPRYELVKAEAETLAAESALGSAELRVGQALDALRRVLGVNLQEALDIEDEPLARPELPALVELKQELVSTHPLLREAAANVRGSNANIEQERSARWSQITVKLASERDPDNSVWRVGVSVPIPIWNRRAGQIQEAQSVRHQAQAEELRVQHDLVSALNQAYGQYEISRRQVEAFESGLMKEAESALRVAEAAYRFGERGIIDYLDAQRIWRNAQVDFLNARFELQMALIEIERIRALPLMGEM